MPATRHAHGTPPPRSTIPTATRATLALVTAMTTIAAGVSAAAIPIVNPGFETDPVADGTFPVFVPTGWLLYDPTSINGGNNTVGVLNPTGTTFFPTGAPEGSNVALVFLGRDIGRGEMGLRQTLPAQVTARTRYVLRYAVGNIASGTGLPPFDAFGFYDLDGFPGYRVELRAGNEILVVDDNTLAPVLSEGTFLTTAIEASVGGNDDVIGEPLEIRLINLNRIDTPAAPGIEVNFDALHLIACPIDPAALTAAWTCVAGPAIPAALCDADASQCNDGDGDGDIDMHDAAWMMRIVES